MSSRFVRDDTFPAIIPVATTTSGTQVPQIAVGDLVAMVSNYAVAAADTVWTSAIASPTAPVVTDVNTGGNSDFTTATWNMKISYQFPWGEGALSAATATVMTAGHAMRFAPVAIPSPVLWINVYVETTAGGGTFKLAGINVGQVQFITDIGANGAAPYAGNAGNVAVTSAATDMTQNLFATTFAGVSGQQKLTGSSTIFGSSLANVMRVNTSGVFEFDTASASYNVGDLVGPAKASGNALLSQTVTAVVHDTLAIGEVVEATSSLTKVKVRILPRKTKLALTV